MGFLIWGFPSFPVIIQDEEDKGPGSRKISHHRLGGPHI